MVHGTLEVLLVGAKGLENTDYLCTHRLNLQHSPFSLSLFACDLSWSIVSMGIGASGLVTIGQLLS